MKEEEGFLADPLSMVEKGHRCQLTQLREMPVASGIGGEIIITDEANDLSLQEHVHLGPGQL